MLAPLALAAVTKPVEFRFSVPASPAAENPFAREIWAEVTTPSGRSLHLPAYFDGADVFVIRARPDEAGVYSFGAVTEAGVPLPSRLHSPAQITNPQVTLRPAIGRDPENPTRFRRGDGTAFVPLGANLAWAPSPPVEFYRRSLADFAQADLNWMRVWMAHWGGLNLDWLPGGHGASPAPGELDRGVAEAWDQILEAAEDRGVYVQVVLQHHGQYSTTTNPNWPQNPWNAANPRGFLHSPAEFFSSDRARRLTAQKYRYIAARWGWSPAVFAWELFNEVHWVDAMRGPEEDRTAVAAWHTALARVLRAADAYHHLVTTSTEDLRSPIYAEMDFYQPHLYGANIVAAARTHAPAAVADRPVFYGEVGDDHMPVTDAVKQSGATIVPPVWASLMGRSTAPAQPWEGERLIDRGRLNELGAVHRFIEQSGFVTASGLAPFSAVVETTPREPARIAAAQVWQRRAAPEFTMPLDGREPLELGDVPAYLVSASASAAGGFTGAATFHFHFPQATTLRAHVTEVGRKGGGLRVRVDGQPVATPSWSYPIQSAEVVVPVGAGEHTVVFDNPAGPDYVGLAAVDLGMDVPVLASIGQRSGSFVALWVWQRTQLFTLDAPAAVTGTVVIADLPAGRWEATWWDTIAGRPTPPIAIEHPGGELRVPTPPIGRHAALVLRRDDVRK